MNFKNKLIYEEIIVATDEFSIKNSLFEGKDGTVFRSQLDCKINIK